MVMPFKPSAAKPSPERGSRSPAVLAWIHLLRAYMKIDRAVEQRLPFFGLPHPQFRLANPIHRCSRPNPPARSHGPTQQECSHALYVDKANLSGIGDRLSRTGLVDRIPDPVDRRYNRIYMTPRGRDVLAAARAEVEALLREVFGGLSSEEQERLQHLLGRLHKGLE